MATATTVQPIEIDTATLAKPIGRTAHIRIGGVVFEAHCPKDAVLARIQSEGTNSIEVIEQVITAMIGREGGDQVREMLADEDNVEVSLMTLSELVRYLMENPDGPQWGEALADSMQALGSGETPRTVPVQQQASPARTKSPARATKKTVARKR